MTTFLDTHPDDATTTYTQPTITPTAKVKAVGLAGIAMTVVPLIITLLAVMGIDAGSPEAATNQVLAVIGAVVTICNAINSLVLFVSGYMKKSDTANGAVKGIK